MSDDFGFGLDDHGPTNEKAANDFTLEQRATERQKEEIKASGYRDAYQAHFESESFMQIGFDVAFKQLAKLSFLCGQIRSLAAYSTRFGKDSAFLAHLNDKLTRIEQFSFENLLDWTSSSEASSSTPSVDESRLRSFVSDHEAKLEQLRAYLLQTASSASSSIDLNEINIQEQEEATEDQEKANNDDLKNLNNLLESLKWSS